MTNFSLAWWCQNALVTRWVGYLLGPKKLVWSSMGIIFTGFVGTNSKLTELVGPRVLTVTSEIVSGTERWCLKAESKPLEFKFNPALAFSFEYFLWTILFLSHPASHLSLLRVKLFIIQLIFHLREVISFHFISFSRGLLKWPFKWNGWLGLITTALVFKWGSLLVSTWPFQHFWTSHLC